MNTLYLCYLGLREPLVQTQVLPYLRHLSRGGVDVHLLTFEPNRRRAWFGEQARDWRSRLEQDGIHWRSLPYHKRPSVPATLYDMAAGAWMAQRLVRRHRIDVVHARSHVPMAMALVVQRLTGCRVIFDFRGLLAEEYAAAGTWAEGSWIFRAVKWLERVGLRRADQVVVLTQRMRAWLVERGLVSEERIEVIPCCVDVARIDQGDANGFESDADRFEVVYAGSVTGLYLLDHMARFFAALRAQQPGALFRILTHAPRAEVLASLKRVGLCDGDVWVGAVKPEDVPAYLRHARLGLSFRRPTPAQIAACPTKIPEYLAAGVPVVCNAGVGDMDELVEQERVGVVVRACDTDGYAAAAAQALTLLREPDLRARCQQVARQHFDLEQVGAARYQRLYRRLMPRRTRVLFLVPYPKRCAPSQRLKFEQYYPSLEAQGIDVTISPFVCQALWRVLYEPGHLVKKVVLTLYGYVRRLWDFLRAPHFDAVYIHLWAVPFGPPWFEEWLAGRGIPLIYDIDDLIYLPRASRANAFLSRFRKEERIARIIGVARHVIVCTAYLEQFARRYNRAVTRISSTIDTAVYAPRRHSTKTRSITIGWSGSHSTSPYLHLLVPVLRTLASRFDIRLLVVGDPRFRMDGVRVEARPWLLERETADLAEMDIGVYPLPDEEWVLGKSGLKALQYMGMGVPVVASAIGEACGFIRDGENGFLARTPEEWSERLSGLILDPARRATMGAAGRLTVEARFSVRVTAPAYQQVLTSVLGSGPAIQEPSTERGGDVAGDRLQAAPLLAQRR